MHKYFKLLTLILIFSSKPGITADIKIGNILTNSVLAELMNTTNAINFQIKRNQPYDESKDPALRKGTENWEQDQGSYFTVPALVLGVVGLLMFFARNKD